MITAFVAVPKFVTLCSNIVKDVFMQSREVTSKYNVKARDEASLEMKLEMEDKRNHKD